MLKTRASHHQPEIREFRITPEGIVLGEPIDLPRLPISTPAASRPTDEDALAGAFVLLERLDGNLPIGLLVFDAETIELVHANPRRLDFVDPGLTFDELVQSRRGARRALSRL